MSVVHSNYSEEVIELLHLFQNYSTARTKFLDSLNLSKSCRDPFSEFSEILVSKILNATITNSRVQKGYDLIRQNGRLVQVKYLSNPSKKWINEHKIEIPENVDEFALVSFVSLQLESILVFQKETLFQVCSLFGKKHPNQDKTLQFTKRNYDTIFTNKSQFLELGVEIYQFVN